jgi:hypothetical protein
MCVCYTFIIHPISLPVSPSHLHTHTHTHTHTQVMDQAQGKAIDSVGYTRAFFELFEGAIYMHQVCVCVCVSACVRVCVCDNEYKMGAVYMHHVCVCLCVCVCVYEKYM